MRALDTNVLVRLVTRDDRKQVAAAESSVSKGAWVSTLVLVEASWILTAVYALTKAEMATAIDMLLHHRDLTLQESDSVAAAPSNIVTARRWGFSDCLILEIARKAATFLWEPLIEIFQNSMELKDCSSVGSLLRSREQTVSSAT